MHDVGHSFMTTDSLMDTSSDMDMSLVLDSNPQDKQPWIDHSHMHRWHFGAPGGHRRGDPASRWQAGGDAPRKSAAQAAALASLPSSEDAQHGQVPCNWVTDNPGGSLTSPAP